MQLLQFLFKWDRLFNTERALISWRVESSEWLTIHLVATETLQVEKKYGPGVDADSGSDPENSFSLSHRRKVSRTLPGHFSFRAKPCGCEQAPCISTKPVSVWWSWANLLRTDKSKSDVAKGSRTCVLRPRGGMAGGGCLQAFGTWAYVKES